MNEPKLTPWFPASVPPVRDGVYEIKGTRFTDPNFRRWNGTGWSGTWVSPSPNAQRDVGDQYGIGEDMTGWRGLASDPSATVGKGRQSTEQNNHG